MEKDFKEDFIKEVLNIKGKVRTFDFLSNLKFIKKKKGEEGIKKVKDFFRKLGFSLIEEERKDIFPLSFRFLLFYFLKNSLGFKKEEIEEMGRYSVKKAFLLKFFSRFFSSPAKFFLEKVPILWKKYVSIGELFPEKFDSANRKATLLLKGIDIPSKELNELGIAYLQGVFRGWVEVVTGSEEVSCQGKKVSNEKYKFTIEWK